MAASSGQIQDLEGLCPAQFDGGPPRPAFDTPAIEEPFLWHCLTSQMDSYFKKCWPVENILLYVWPEHHLMSELFQWSFYCALDVHLVVK